MVLAVAFGPGMFWLWYFVRKDKFEPEPLALIRTCFILGMLAVLPAGLLEWPLYVTSRNLATVAVAPVVEELCKFAVVRFTVYRNREFDEPMDGVIYAVSVALGFASLENLFYLGPFYGQGEGSFTTIAVIRAFLSVPGHALFSSMWGYGLGFAKFADGPRRKRLIISGLALAMGLHAAFNLACLSGPFWALGMVIVVPVSWALARRKMREAFAAARRISVPDDPAGDDAES